MITVIIPRAGETMGQSADKLAAAFNATRSEQVRPIPSVVFININTACIRINLHFALTTWQPLLTRRDFLRTRL